MNALIPTKIESPRPFLIAMAWPDGFEATITTEAFRNACPCASCKGEQIMGRTVVLPQMRTFSPGMFELAGINPMGNYAIQVGWKDGHNTGIYPWELLRSIAEQNALSAEKLEELLQKERKQSNDSDGSRTEL